MKIVIALACAILLAGPSVSTPAPIRPGPDEEEIVFIRHGEKPDAGLGQLDCQGLNRALALPRALAGQIGRPDAIWAANPSSQKDDHGVAFDYVRPLATIEPTAIALGLPVRTDFGLDRPDALMAALDDPKYGGRTLLVAWEHKQIVEMARTLMAKHGGDAGAVQKWPKDDFDSIYIVRIRRSGPDTKARFALGHEGLETLSTHCP